MLKSFKKFSQKVVKSERGQGMVEYILLLVVVVALLMAFKGQISKAIGDRTGQLTNSINSFGSDN